jgi:hypothetical protein
MIVPQPTCYPMPMARYGLNPHGEPLYRLVYAPSVKKLVGGKFPDGFTGYRARPAYRHIGEHWIIEKWISALELTRMTEEQYNSAYRDRETQLFPTGPYPLRGIYYYCETLSCNPAEANIDKLVMWLEHAKYVDPAENRRQLLSDIDKAERDDQSNRFAWADDKKRASGIRAANFGGMVKAQKSYPMEKSANELGLPMKGPRVMEMNHAV